MNLHTLTTRLSAALGLTVAAGLALTALETTAALADTVANSALVNLGTYAVPSHAPAYVPGGDLLPRIPGTLGNATQILMGASSVEAMAVPNDNWGTQVVTQTGVQGAAQQTFYFQLVGTVGIHTAVSDAASHPVNYGPLPDYYIVEPVYRIIHFGANGPACLDDFGGGSGDATLVDSYRCNPNQVNQTNQLWMISGPSTVMSLLNPDGTPAPAGSGEGNAFTNLDNPHTGNAIASLASVLAHGDDTANAQVVSASYTDLNGVNSGLWLYSQWPATTYNATWHLASAIIPPGGNSSPSKPDCYGIACIVTIF